MNNEKDFIRKSKFLSMVLRHQPEEIGIELDKNGWVSIEMLLEKANRKGMQLDLETLLKIVETNPKKRFAINETGDKIRASQGHSVEIELGYSPQEPPAILYHGTGEKNVKMILTEGLKKMSRHHVHLSKDIATAINVGSRHGKPVIFEVNTAKMYADGFLFYLSENKVWLTDNVPVKYLRKSEHSF